MWVNLLLINLIVSLLWNTGIWESLDYYISKRFPLRHLPQIIFCQLCLCWWISLAYVILSGNFSLLAVGACLLNGHLTKITIPALKIVEEWVLRALEWISPR